MRVDVGHTLITWSVRNPQYIIFLLTNQELLPLENCKHQWPQNIQGKAPCHCGIALRFLSCRMVNVINVKVSTMERCISDHVKTSRTTYMHGNNITCSLQAVSESPIFALHACTLIYLQYTNIYIYFISRVFQHACSISIIWKLPYTINAKLRQVAHEAQDPSDVSCGTWEAGGLPILSRINHWKMKVISVSYLWFLSNDCWPSWNSFGMKLKIFKVSLKKKYARKGWDSCTKQKLTPKFPAVPRMCCE